MIPWALTCYKVPEKAKEIMKGSDTQKVDKANFNGCTLTAMPSLSWAKCFTKGVLAKESVKRMYFGGMRCPYCPPFTEKLKVFFNAVREAIGENAVKVIFCFQRLQH